jgi:hypothetical protein
MYLKRKYVNVDTANTSNIISLFKGVIILSLLLNANIYYEMGHAIIMNVVLLGNCLMMMYGILYSEKRRIDWEW